MTAKFTGFHMTAILVAFFGIVITVNVVMARYAVSTFGGTVVDNSYVASQNYNRWLAEADKQQALGWNSRISLTQDRVVQIAVTRRGSPLAGLSATGVARHPLGMAAAIPLTFAPGENGTLRSVSSLPSGRWDVTVTLQDGSDSFRQLQVLQ